jgi:hypothetical protein
MQGTPGELDENREAFFEQLRELNKSRATFVANRTNMTAKQIEEYLNQEPEIFKNLAGSFAIEEALESLTHEYTLGCIRAIETMLKRSPRDRKKQKFYHTFQRLFNEEICNENWDSNLAEPAEDDRLRMCIAKLKALVLFLNRDTEVIEKIKTEFLLELATCGEEFNIQIPDQLIALLPDKVKKVLGERIAKNAATKGMCSGLNTDDRLRLYTTVGAIDQSTLERIAFLSKTEREKIAQTLQESLKQQMSTKQKEDLDREQENDRLELVELLKKYPNPGVIIDLLLQQ